MLCFPILGVVRCHRSFPSLYNIMRMVFARPWFDVALVLIVTEYIIPFSLLYLLGFQFFINFFNLFLSGQDIILAYSWNFLHIDWVIDVVYESVPFSFVDFLVVFGVGVRPVDSHIVMGGPRVNFRIHSFYPVQIRASSRHVSRIFLPFFLLQVFPLSHLFLGINVLFYDVVTVDSENFVVSVCDCEHVFDCVLVFCGLSTIHSNYINISCIIISIYYYFLYFHYPKKLFNKNLHVYY